MTNEESFPWRHLLLIPGIFIALSAIRFVSIEAAAVWTLLFSCILVPYSYWESKTASGKSGEDSTIAYRLREEWITAADIEEANIDELRSLRNDVVEMIDSGGSDMSAVGMGLLLTRMNAEISARENDD